LQGVAGGSHQAACDKNEVNYPSGTGERPLVGIFMHSRLDRSLEDSLLRFQGLNIPIVFCFQSSNQQITISDAVSRQISDADQTLVICRSSASQLFRQESCGRVKGLSWNKVNWVDSDFTIRLPHGDCLLVSGASLEPHLPPSERIEGGSSPHPNIGLLLWVDPITDQTQLRYDPPSPGSRTTQFSRERLQDRIRESTPKLTVGSGYGRFNDQTGWLFDHRNGESEVRVVTLGESEPEHLDHIVVDVATYEVDFLAE
jgi:hypothetical protein